MQVLHCTYGPDSKINGASEWPGPGTVALPVNHPDVVAFRTPPPSAGDVTREYERRITLALGTPNKQASMSRERGELNALLAAGTPLSPEQTADAAMLKSINDWETAMIGVRQALIAATDRTPMFIDATWPSPPPGLPEFLAEY